ncbi:MAG: hypothetical protein U9O85_00005 [Euryarchaeota archaeon]|nr:hypothetical protein [Euryarchaeota archaeon]
MPIIAYIIIGGTFVGIYLMLQILILLKIIWYSIKDWKKIQKIKATPIIYSRIIIPSLRKLYFISKYRDCIHYLAIYPRYCIYKGWKSAQCYPKFMSDNEHDAIIIVHEKFAKECMYGGIDLLIEFLVMSHKP